jgi:hypothetical protein
LTKTNNVLLSTTEKFNLRLKIIKIQFRKNIQWNKRAKSNFRPQFSEMNGAKHSKYAPLQTSYKMRAAEAENSMRYFLGDHLTGPYYLSHRPSDALHCGYLREKLPLLMQAMPIVARLRGCFMCCGAAISDYLNAFDPERRLVGTDLCVGYQDLRNLVYFTRIFEELKNNTRIYY